MNGKTDYARNVKPCPKCGSRMIGHLEKYIQLACTKGKRKYLVCIHCGLEQGPHMKWYKAVQVWNKLPRT